MKFRSVYLAALLLAGISAPSAFATEITSFSGVITTSSKTELGRLSRQNQPQQWNGVEKFPGVANSGTTYYYNTYTLSNSFFNPNNFLDVSFTDAAGSGYLFVSAYANSFDPTSLSKNWLGDLGFNSIAYGPADSLTFDVVMPAGSDLVLVVNTTGGGTLGTNLPFDIFVSGYSDPGFDEAPITPYVAPTPEPSTFIELGTAVVAMAGFARRRYLSA